MIHAHHTTALVIAMACLALGCKARTSPQASKADQSKPAPKAKPVPFDSAYFQTPTEQLARPSVLMLRKLGAPSKPAGTRLTADKKSTPLAYVGLNRCAQGWAIQPFYQPEATGKVRPLPPIYLPKNVIKPAQAIQTNGAIHPLKQTISATFDAFSTEQLKGTIKTIAPRTKAVTTWTIDTAPINVPAARGLGLLGCYHTGHYTLTTGPHTHRAPATGLWERAGMYRMYLPFNKTDRLIVWLRLPEHKRQPNEVLRVNLNDVFKAPKKHDIRVLFERIQPGVPTIDGGIPAQHGKLQLAFKANKTGGPITLMIKGLSLPDRWRKDRATLPKTVDINATIGFTTDLRGILVPVNPVPQ